MEYRGAGEAAWRRELACQVPVDRDLEVRLHRQKRETAPQSMDDPITTEYAQNCQMYDFIVGLADLLSGGTTQQKEDEIAYLTEGGVLEFEMTAKPVRRTAQRELPYSLSDE